MGHHRNAVAEDGRRTWDIPTIGLFALVTLTALIGVPLFGYVHGYTKLDWALSGPERVNDFETLALGV